MKAEAAATAGGIAMWMLVGAAATALGIGVNAGVNNESYQQSCEQIGNEVQKKIAADGKVLSTLVTVGANNVLTMSKEFLFDVAQAGAKFFPPVDMDFSQSGFSAFKSWAESASGLTMEDSNKIYSWQAAFQCGDSFLKYCRKWKVTGKTTFAQPVGKDYKKVQIGAFAGLPFYAYQVSAASGNAFSILIPSAASCEKFWGFTGSESSYGVPEFIVGPSSVFLNLEAFDCQKQEAVEFLLQVGDNPWQGICAYPKTAQPLPYTGEDVFNPADKAFFAEGYSAMIHSFADVVARIGAIQGVIDGIRVKIGSLSIPGIRSLTQTTILEKDITTEKDTDADDTRNKGRSTTVPKDPSMPHATLPKGIQNKFPFCLPWDLAACYRLFDVTPKAPTWNIPVNIDCGAVHVHHTYTYDLNNNNVLDQGLPVFKWFVNLAFVAGLIILTRKIMS